MSVSRMVLAGVLVVSIAACSDTDVVTDPTPVIVAESATIEEAASGYRLELYGVDESVQSADLASAIANARIELESGCVANLTASRVSAERVRRLRAFLPDRGGKTFRARPGKCPRLEQDLARSF